MTQPEQRVEELKPCPFCGADPVARETPDDQDGASFYIMCPDCDCSPADCYISLANKGRAIAAWNRRPAPPAAQPNVALSRQADDFSGYVDTTIDTPSAELSPGQVQWHSSGEDNGPDVGILIGLGEGKALWLGELLVRDGATTGMVFYDRQRKSIVAPIENFDQVRELLENYVAPAITALAATPSARISSDKDRENPVEGRGALREAVSPRPFSEWHEDHRDVLWFRHPICEPPYCGSPLDLGRSACVSLTVGREQVEDVSLGNVGGWPFDEEDEPNLWWLPLPDSSAVDAAIRAALGTGSGEG